MDFNDHFQVKGCNPLLKLAKQMRLRILSILLLSVWSCSGVYDDCVSLPSEFATESAVSSKIKSKGWEIRGDQKNRCAHTVLITMSSHDYGNGYMAYFAAASWVDRHKRDGPSVFTSTGPTRTDVLDTLMDALVTNLPVKNK